MANPGEHEILTPNVDQGTGLPDMMPRDPDAGAEQIDDLNQAGNRGALSGAGLDRRGQPSAAEGAFGAATGSDYGSGAGAGNEQATGGGFGRDDTQSEASGATGSTGAGLGERGEAGWSGSGGGASPSVGALSGSNAHGVGDGDGTTRSSTDATGGTLGTFGGTDRAGDTATEDFSGPTAPEPERSTMPQQPTRSSQVDAADQNQYGGGIHRVAPEERQNEERQQMEQGMTGDQGITPDTRQGGI